MKTSKFINVESALPASNSNVEVITNIGNTHEVRFEMFLGNQVWEFDYPEDGEEVLGWRYIEYE